MKFTVIVLSALILAQAYADLMPKGHHVVFRNVVINNMDDFPGLTFIGRVQGPMTNYSYILTNNVPLAKGYKFNTFFLYAVSNSVLASKGGLDKLSYGLTNVNIIDPGNYLVPDESALTGETVLYSILDYSNQNAVLKIVQRKLDFNNGSPAVISNFEPDGK